MSLPDYLLRSAKLVVAQPQWKWFGAWLVATLEVCLGPLDRGPVQILFGLFLLDTLLGSLDALLRGKFRCRRLSYACVKAAIYFTLLSAAWLFRRSDALELLPVGVVLATGLEGFLLFTEGMSVLRNGQRATGNGQRTLRRLGVDTSRLSRLIKLHAASKPIRRSRSKRKEDQP